MNYAVSRRGFSGILGRFGNFVGTVVEIGEGWFLLFVVLIGLFMVGYCVLVFFYDPVAIMNSRWLAP